MGVKEMIDQIDTAKRTWTRPTRSHVPPYQPTEQVAAKDVIVGDHIGTHVVTIIEHRDEPRPGGSYVMIRGEQSGSTLKGVLLSCKGPEELVHIRKRTAPKVNVRMDEVRVGDVFTGREVHDIEVLDLPAGPIVKLLGKRWSSGAHVPVIAARSASSSITVERKGE